MVGTSDVLAGSHGSTGGIHGIAVSPNAGNGEHCSNYDVSY